MRSHETSNIEVSADELDMLVRVASLFCAHICIVHIVHHTCQWFTFVQFARAFHRHNTLVWFEAQSEGVSNAT